MSRLNRWVPIAAVVALLGLATFAAVFGNPTVTVIDSVGEGEAITGPVRTASPVQVTAPAADAGLGGRVGVIVPDWLANLLSLICAGAMVSVVVAMGWFLLRDRLAEYRAGVSRTASSTPTPEQIQGQVRDAVDAGLADLDDADADPRRAVIACWVGWERAAAAAGTPRAVGETTTEFVTRLLGSVPEELLTSFAAIYQEARFATHTIDSGMRDRARAALHQLRRELAPR